MCRSGRISSQGAAAAGPEVDPSGCPQRAGADAVNRRGFRTRPGGTGSRQGVRQIVSNANATPKLQAADVTQAGP